MNRQPGVLRVRICYSLVYTQQSTLSYPPSIVINPAELVEAEERARREESRAARGAALSKLVDGTGDLDAIKEGTRDGLVFNQLVASF